MDVLLSSYHGPMPVVAMEGNGAARPIADWNCDRRGSTRAPSNLRARIERSVSASRGMRGTFGVPNHVCCDVNVEVTIREKHR